MTSQQTNKALIFILILQLVACICPTEAVKCPQNCKCAWVLDSLEVDCSRSGLTDYPNFDEMPIEHLDLSGNYFVEFPKHLADIESLIYLDLSNNQLEYIADDALLGFNTLRTLLLANNSISGWSSLSPNVAFRHANSLKRLSLSGNHLGSFTDDIAQDMLVSGTLSHLELERCGITVAGGDHLMNGLPNLERLQLSGNSLTTIASLPSKSLRVLELSDCNLKRMSTELLQGLPSLEALNLTWNTALQFGVKANDIIASHSLNELDLSYCNLDAIDLSGLPGLMTVRLRGNMLRTLGVATFANNTQLEVIDLARNSLRLVEGDAFGRLKRLTRLNLSYNEIARLDRNLFRANDVLVSLDLSRNVIEKFVKLVSNSLRDINLSWCEIITIDATAFSGLSSIQSLDLSNNLIKDFPGGMHSETLQRLNLSNCRLSNIRNNTFRDFPELASLRLNGNRFTNPFPNEYFRSNKFLDEIWIGDNPWICSCQDATFMDFYDFLTAKPQKLKDKNNVRCASPATYYGKTWESACIGVWLPNGRTSNAERVWSTIMICIAVILVLVFLFSCFQKYMKSRKQQHNHREYRRNQDELNEIRRQNQRMLDEEASPNAPTAFETNLPSYEDAIAMPKPVRPVKSMVDLSSSSARARKKLQRTRTDPEEDIIEEGDEDDYSDLMLDNRHRFRSVEMLSNRDKERTAPMDPFRRTGRIEHNTSGSRRFSIEDSRFPAAHLKSQNLQSAEQIGNFQSYENSPYTKRRTQIAEIPPFRRATLRPDSIEFLTDPEFDGTSVPSSPFAKRTPKPMSPPPPSLSRTVDAFDAGDGGGGLAPAVEDYFGAAVHKSRTPSSDGSSSSGFQVIVEPELASLADENSSSTRRSDIDLDKDERGKRKKRKNSSSRRTSGSFSAAAAAASDSSSSEREPIVVVHKPMRETLF